MIALIVAYAKNRVIGNKGQIPWRIKGEQKRFKELTTGNVVVMGRRSYEEIGRPLPNRMTYVVSNTKNFDEEGVKTVKSLKEAIDLAGDKDIFISGGAGLYKEAIDLVDVMYNTEIDALIEGDTYFPLFDESEFVKTVDACVDGEIPYRYVTYTRKTAWERHPVSQKETIKYYPVEALDETGLVISLYTTNRDSAWKYGKPGAEENCKRLADTLGIDINDMVMLNQTHSDGIRVITRKDAGEMVTRPLTKDGFDGMITNEKGLMLCTVEADCVPIYLLDPVHEAIGMVHSGWKGTAKEIGANAVRLMIKTYGSNPKDMLIAIGPCICADCYEVGAELKDEFAGRFSKTELEEIFVKPHGEKYNLDLKKAITISLKKQGIKTENIIDTGRCTREDDELCSWRRDNPVMRSMLTGIMMIKK
ncbi:MAG: peptidoglycan editing factor PgeF [Lachnospiraceae bacterium]|nr:peptidoglycan editing factor PgeF [Lachnospiraceae bacterium]